MSGSARVLTSMLSPTAIIVWLGGVKIPHSRALSGHSDADVALHAITDALLGAIGDGDIGAHFPPSDAAMAGRRIPESFLKTPCGA